MARWSLVFLFGTLMGLPLKSALAEEGSHIAADSSSSTPASNISGGLSVIEDIIQNKWGGEIPSQSYKEFEEKLKSDLSNATNGVSISGLLVPDSRSLQREHSNYDLPRSLFEISPRHPVNGGDSTTFVGYAPEAQQIELISWNSQLGRYEFSIIDGFGPGKKPQLKRADRNFCMTCHQHGGPIFSRFPWAETSQAARAINPLRNKLESHINRETGLPKTERAKDIAEFSKEYQSNKNSSAFTIDSLVRNAANRLQFARMCREVCKKEDQECQEALLKSALLGGTFPSAVSTEGDTLRKEVQKRYGEALTRNWPSDLFAYPSSILLDRDPLANEASGGLGSYFEVADEKLFQRDFRLSNNSMPALKKLIRNWVLTEDELRSSQNGELQRSATRRNLKELIQNPSLISFEEIFATNELSTREGITKLGIVGMDGVSNLLNPKTPRPLINSIYPDVVADKFIFTQNLVKFCLRFTIENADILARMNTKQMRSGILNADFKSLLDHWPPDQEKIMAKLVEIERTPVAMLLAVSNRPVASDPSSGTLFNAVKVLDKHCAECHGKEDSAIPLPLTDLSALKSGHAKKMWKKLENFEMPPPSARGPQLSLEDRNKLKELFKLDEE